MQFSAPEAPCKFRLLTQNSAKTLHEARCEEEMHFRSSVPGWQNGPPEMRAFICPDSFSFWKWRNQLGPKTPEKARKRKRFATERHTKIKNMCFPWGLRLKKEDSCLHAYRCFGAKMKFLLSRNSFQSFFFSFSRLVCVSMPIGCRQETQRYVTPHGKGCLYRWRRLCW